MALSVATQKIKRLVVAIGSRFAFTLLALIIMGLSGFLSIHGAMQMTNTVSSLLEVQKRREVAQQFLSYLKDTERGQRGYLVTGDDSYLQPYVIGKSSTIQMFTRLRQIHAADNSWQDTLNYVETRLRAKFEEMDSTIRIRREEGLTAAAAIVKTNEGKRLMEDITLSLMQMVARESNILSMSDFNYRAVMTESVVGYAVSNVLVLGLMVITLMMIEARRRLLNAQLRSKTIINAELNVLKEIEFNEISGVDAIKRLRKARENISAAADSEMSV